MEMKVIRKDDFLHLGSGAQRDYVIDMHELSLTQNILNAALEHANGKRIARVNLRIGELSDEREESIRFYWDELVRDTPAREAQLHFQCVEAEMKCLECETVFRPVEETCSCPNCSSLRLKLLSGDDVRLESIDVE